MSAAGIYHSEHYTKQENKLMESPEKIISIMNEYTQHSPQMGYPIPSESNEKICDTIRTEIFQKKGNSVFILLTIPVTATVNSIYGEVDAKTTVIPKEKIANAYGVSDGFNFNQNTPFKPGDYCMGLVFASEEEAQSVESVKLELRHEPITNLMISHMIFGLCKELGFDPSHVMKYPVKSVVRAVPFYKKTHGDITKLKEDLDEIISEKLHLLENASTIQTQEIQNKLEDLKRQISEVSSPQINTASIEKEKGVLPENSVSFEDYIRIKKERDLYYGRLQEAEDYIEDHIIPQEEKSVPLYYPNAHLSKGTRSLLGRRK